MKHRYYKISHGEYEVRDKRTRVILGYIFTRVMVLSRAGNDRLSVVRVKKLGNDHLEPEVFHNRRDALVHLQGLQ